MSLAAAMADAAEPAPPYSDGDRPTPGPWKACSAHFGNFRNGQGSKGEALDTLVKSARQPDRSQEKADPSSVARAIVDCDCSHSADICSKIAVNALSLAPGDSGHTLCETLTQTDLRA